MLRRFENRNVTLKIFFYSQGVGIQTPLPDTYWRQSPCAIKGNWHVNAIKLITGDSLNFSRAYLWMECKFLVRQKNGEAGWQRSWAIYILLPAIMPIIKYMWHTRLYRSISVHHYCYHSSSTLLVYRTPHSGANVGSITCLQVYSRPPYVLFVYPLLRPRAIKRWLAYQ